MDTLDRSPFIILIHKLGIPIYTNKKINWWHIEEQLEKKQLDRLYEGVANTRAAAFTFFFMWFC